MALPRCAARAAETINRVGRARKGMASVQRYRAQDMDLCASGVSPDRVTVQSRSVDAFRETATCRGPPQTP